MNKELMFSSKKQDYETPQDFFEKLDNEFHFTLILVLILKMQNVKCILLLNKMD